MKKKLIVCLLLSCVLTLCGCAETVSYKDNLSAYERYMEYHDGFNILQLADIHWSTGTDPKEITTYLDGVIKTAEEKCGKIDLIELTGDNTMLSSRTTVKDFIKYMESLGIPFATVWGNHDREGKFSQSWLSKQYANAENSLYTEVDDDVYGYSNYVINLKKDNLVKWQIFNIDSGASYTDAVGFGRTYDYIRESQTEWFLAEHKRVGNNVPCIAYSHIAQWEFQRAFEAVEKGDALKNSFFKTEGFASSEVSDSDFFNVAKENKLKALFVGHAHGVDWTVDYEGVTIGFGVKSTKELSYAKIEKDDETIKPEWEITENFDLVGASLVTLHDDGTFDLNHLYYNLDDDGNEIFVRWVKY